MKLLFRMIDFKYSSNLVQLMGGFVQLLCKLGQLGQTCATPVQTCVTLVSTCATLIPTWATRVNLYYLSIKKDEPIQMSSSCLVMLYLILANLIFALGINYSTSLASPLTRHAYHFPQLVRAQ